VDDFDVGRRQEAFRHLESGEVRAVVFRRAGSVGPVGGSAQELIQVFPDDPVEHARLRVTGQMALACTAHAPV